MGPPVLSGAPGCIGTPPSLHPPDSAAPPASAGPGQGGAAATAPSAPLHQHQQSPPSPQPLLEWGNQPSSSPRDLVFPRNSEVCHPCPLPCGSAGSELLRGLAAPQGTLPSLFSTLPPAKVVPMSTPPWGGGKWGFLPRLTPWPGQASMPQLPPSPVSPSPVYNPTGSCKYPSLLQV